MDENNITERQFYILALGVVITAATFRLWHLGQFGFWTDELYHVLAAKSLLENGQPIIPLTGRYNRAIEFTYIVMLSFKLLGISEFSARLPSVVLSLLFIVVALLLLKNTIGKLRAILFAFLFAISPIGIELARECRMYSLFLLLYFSSMLIFYHGFEPNNIRPLVPIIDKNFHVSFLALATAGIIMLASYQIHTLSINSGIVILLYCSTLLLIHTFRDGPIKALRSKYFIVSFVGIASILLVALAQSDLFNYLLGLARQVPKWSKFGDSDYLFYKNLFFNHHPFLFCFYIVGIAALIRHKPKFGFFVLLAFIAILLLHSFVFGRKNERYVFYIYPFFLLGAVYGLEPVISRFRYFIMKKLSGTPVLASLTVFFTSLAFIALVAWPAPELIRHMYQTNKHPDWKRIPSQTIAQVNQGIVFTTRIKEFNYYFGITPHYFVRAMQDESNSYKNLMQMKLISDLEQLQSAVDKQTNRQPVYFVTDKWSLGNSAIISEPMKEYIRSQFKHTLASGDGNIVIFASDKVL